MLHQPAVTSAIVGASSPEQLDAAFEAAQLELDDDTLRACDAAWWSLPRRSVFKGIGDG